MLVGQAGRYKVLTLLTQGGMASIHLARTQGEPEGDRFVVAKALLSAMTDKRRFREMFEDEARISAMFDHPNIVRTLDVAGNKSDQTIIMEFLAGESLAYLVRTAFKRGQPLPPTLVALVGAQVCAGLDHAHRLRAQDGRHLNIIHRDVSPQNIIVLFSGLVKLVDFGIAQAMNRKHETRTGVRKGKVCYMSPEQAVGANLDPRSDLFSLGTVLWEVLTCKRLFKRKRELDSLRAIADCEVPAVSDLVDEVPEAIESVVMRALNKDPAARYSSAGHMATALRNAMRRMGRLARKRDMAVFYRDVLDDVLVTKRKLLKAMEGPDAEVHALPSLAPNTEATLPSSPELNDMPESDELAEPERDLIERVDAEVISDEWQSSADGSGPSDEWSDSSELEPEPDYEVDPEAAGGADKEYEDEEYEDEPFEEDKPNPADLTQRTLRPTDDGSRADEAEQDWGDESTGKRSAKEKPGLRETATRSDHDAIVLPATRSRASVLVIAIASIACLIGFAIVLVLAWPEQNPAPPKAMQPIADPPKSQPDPLKPDPGLPAVDPPVADPPVVAPVENPPEATKPVMAAASLDVRTQPSGCQVKLDGEWLPGKSPIKALSIGPEQEHVVDVRCRNHKPESKRFTPKAGQQVVMLFSPPKAFNSRRSRTGTLKFNTRPWTEVSFKGKSLGITPVLGAKLPAGTHTLVLKNAGAGIDTTVQIIIRAGKTTSMLKKLN